MSENTAEIKFGGDASGATAAAQLNMGSLGQNERNRHRRLKVQAFLPSIKGNRRLKND
jgi:hypothetical protein